MQTTNQTTTVVLYAVVTADGQYFAGFDAQAAQTRKTPNVLDSKLFSNKFDIKLRPNEQIVEVKIDATPNNVTVSEPFRPPRRREAPHNVAAVA